jgi:acetolactate synthase-1/2/3 large subunit
MSCAIGAAIAAPDRKVVVITGDGSALANNQALWTQARERLNILNLVIANRAYRILQMELEASGTKTTSCRSLLEIAPPVIDWAGLSRSLGVPASRAMDRASARESIVRGLSTEGPYLIEIEV